MLLMTSTDGFCSVVIFEPEELGQVYTGPTPPPSTPILSASTVSNPISTSNAKFGSTSNQPQSPVPLRSQPLLARTPSASSIHTLTQGAISLTPIIGSVPSITASASSSGITLTTPPQTPHSGTVLGKRDGEIGVASTQGTPPVVEGGDKKRRRIAPTPVTLSAEKPPEEKAE